MEKIINALSKLVILIDLLITLPIMNYTESGQFTHVLPYMCILFISLIVIYAIAKHNDNIERKEKRRKERIERRNSLKKALNEALK